MSIAERLEAQSQDELVTGAMCEGNGGRWDSESAMWKFPDGSAGNFIKLLMHGPVFEATS
jgi:hypothetical protein